MVAQYGPEWRTGFPRGVDPASDEVEWDSPYREEEADRRKSEYENLRAQWENVRPNGRTRGKAARARYYVLRSESADVPGSPASWFVMDRTLDDAVMFARSRKEAETEARAMNAASRRRRSR